MTSHTFRFLHAAVVEFEPEPASGLVHGNMVGMATGTGARRRWVAAVVVAGLVAGWALFGRGSDDSVARPTPGELTAAEEEYDGARVETVGVVRRFGPEDGATRLHFVVEDKDQNRVGLIGGDPARYVGRTVVVVGTFRFAPDVGRWIEVESLTTQ